MRSFVTLALFAIVATNAIRVTEEPKTGDSTEKKEAHTDAEVKVGKFSFGKAAEADAITQGNKAGVPYEKPLAEKIQDKAQADAIADKVAHSDAVLKNAIAGEKAAKDPKDVKKEGAEDAKKEEKKEEKKAE